MDQLQLQKLSQELKISPVEILREETEMFILQNLSQSPLSEKLIFKGGTTLRLCYNSPRFSQDLDFNQKKMINIGQLKKTLIKLSQENQEISLKEVFKKRFTIFSLLIVKSNLLKQPYSIKIEISTKKYSLEKDDYHLKTCQSSTSPFSPLLYIYSLKRILKEKLLALKTRAEPRDYFDVWFASQKLGKKIKIPKPKIHPSKFKGEISQLLPNNWKNWPKQFLNSYE